MKDMANSHDVQKSIRNYLIVFAALTLLTVLTVAVAYLDLPIVPAIIIALVIATVKGSLVVGYFMHLISEKKVIIYFMILTVVFFLVLIIFTYISFLDQEGVSIVS